MTIRVAISHNTYYTFDRAVELAPHTIRLRPAPHTRTPIHSYSLKIEPSEHFINWQQDAYGNYLARLVFPEPTTKLSVEVEVLADLTVINPFDFFVEDYAEHFPFTYPTTLQKELQPYLSCRKKTKRFGDLLERLPRKKMRSIDYLVKVNSIVNQLVAYTIRMEPGVQTPEQTLKRKKGSCRDSAWLLAQLLRHQGLASRFVSGYLVQLKADEASIDGPSGPSEDFTDLHAWCEVFIPGAGWIGLDPTSGLFASEGHIPLACSAEPQSAAPIEGALEDCEVSFDFSNEVTRFREDPRVTYPYSDDQWHQVLQLGESIDQRLVSEDVRLTMGGEPTFVSIDDMESAQWNTAALGSEKSMLAKQLILKLRQHFAPNGLLHYGQGKWYPGEPLPRWAMSLFWRKDGVALWQHTEYLAKIDSDYGADLQQAQAFMQAVTDHLGLATDSAIPAYEDPLHYLQEEQKLPLQQDLQSLQQQAKLDRLRLQRVMKQAMRQAVGFVLPIDWQNQWRSAAWHFKRQALILIPGDSPIGLRLPLNQLLDKLPAHTERDPFSQAQDLAQQLDLSQSMQASVASAAQQRQSEQGLNISKGKKTACSDSQPAVDDLIITALVIEPRDGKLFIFMPPLPELADYLRLLSVIEAVAVKLDQPVIIEGYEPPRDPRLEKLAVTPDPGVIEVNMHPSDSWQALVTNTEALYRLARETRLGAEKFMLDGRHTGTGGGNHITLGGQTPADSPILRKPNILQSMVTFWQHHPALSYLFSGSFIGPTSQAPRVDEGRDEVLYELEIAFQQMPEGLSDQPWLVDRLFRNCLIDVTGNTHRAEFCIDKLYAPGMASGRLGLLELRGFEMPPHYQMSLVQGLLVRALLLRFWQTPYQHKLVRWGTRLHDKFMLPHYIEQDIREVVKDLTAHGIAFDADWLAPFMEFRFPFYGQVQLDGISLELRWAIEPWHVLGEEVGSFGTARYVDSSVERLQVKLQDFNPERYVLSCNGRRVPLQAGTRQGEYIAGVRYRAWSPPSALHPTLPVNTPLHFDLIDTWNGRSIGGCSYHVSHPGGRNYEVFPINALEAEARRFNRFEQTNHQQGAYTPLPELDALREFTPKHQVKPMAPPAEEPSDDYPFTLDLRTTLS
ncbi:MAG: transglutaminase family protein [Pseudomonadales bacterium]|nr:transglutaminase family protein [Pseudomonadales bacterium]